MKLTDSRNVGNKYQTYSMTEEGQQTSLVLRILTRQQTASDYVSLLGKTRPVRN